jgi:uncharacterized MnhB-related membrane protein
VIVAFIFAAFSFPKVFRRIFLKALIVLRSFSFSALILETWLPPADVEGA